MSNTWSVTPSVRRKGRSGARVRKARPELPVGHDGFCRRREDVRFPSIAVPPSEKENNRTNRTTKSH